MKKQIHMRNRRFYDYSDAPDSPQSPVSGPLPQNPQQRVRRSGRTPVKNKRYLVASLLYKVVDAIVEHCQDEEEDLRLSDDEDEQDPQSIEAIVSDLSPDLQQLVFVSLPPHLRKKTQRSHLQMHDLLSARQAGYIDNQAMGATARQAARGPPPPPLHQPEPVVHQHAPLQPQQEEPREEGAGLSDSDASMPSAGSEEGARNILPSRSSSTDSATSDLAAAADDIAARRYLELSRSLKDRIAAAEEEGKSALQRSIEQALAAAKEKYLTHAYKRLRRRRTDGDDQ